MFDITQEAPGDVPAREALLDRCFGRARWFKTCQRLRRERLPAEGLSFAARADGQLVGTVRLWHIEAGSAGPALLLGPLAVDPSRQSEGIGAHLMRHALAAARDQGHKAVILVGDAPYYARFGFSAALTSGLQMPGPVARARFLGLDLVPGTLKESQGLVRAAGALALPRKRAA
jgi:predicted N-acetyltransferase YhbS